jgi:hypothetical protein
MSDDENSDIEQNNNNQKPNDSPYRTPRIIIDEETRQIEEDILNYGKILSGVKKKRKSTDEYKLPEKEESQGFDMGEKIINYLDNIREYERMTSPRQVNTGRASVVSSPDLGGVFRYRDQLLGPRERNEMLDPTVLYQMSSKPYMPSVQGLPIQMRTSNVFLFEKFLQVREEGFDPLFYTMNQAVEDEIVNRQKEIASDWPLLVVPGKVTNDRDRELYEDCQKQARISNAAQMLLRMIRLGDYLAALQFGIDIYALSTSAATEFNNRRMITRIPELKDCIESGQQDVFRSKAKDMMSHYKSFMNTRDFFLSRGETNTLSPPSSSHSVDFNNNSPFRQTRMSDFFSQEQHPKQTENLLSDIYSVVNRIEDRVNFRASQETKEAPFYKRKNGRRFNFNYNFKAKKASSQGPQNFKAGKDGKY